MRLSCIGTCKTFGLGEMLVSYFWLSTTTFSSQNLMKPHNNQFVNVDLYMVMPLWRSMLIDFGKVIFNYLFLTLPCFMYKIGLLNLHLNIWSTYGSLFPLCSGLGAPRVISASWTRGLGILSTFGMSLELPSPSRYLYRLFRCCFMGCPVLRSCCFPSLVLCGFQGIWAPIFGSDMPR